jgi:Transposase DDE domain
MCQRNWPEINTRLVQNGSLDFVCNSTTIALIKRAKRSSPSDKGGRPPYPKQLILVLILLKIAYRLSYRGCEGMASSILDDFGISTPCYTTICRSMRRLRSILPPLSKRRPKVRLIDSSGFKIVGEGEWKRRVHGASYRRHWVKVHLVTDPDSGEIIDLLVTSSSCADIDAGVALLHQMSNDVKCLIGDGAYDGSRLRRGAYERGISILSPPPKHAKLSSKCYQQERNEAIRIISALGRDLLAKRLWAKLTGYSRRAGIESSFSRLKRLFGSTLFSRHEDAIVVEVYMKALLSNLWLQSN